MQVTSLPLAPVLDSPRTDRSPFHVKTVVMTLVVTLSSVIGNFALAWGMRRVSMLILWLLSQMALLSWADLSYVLPVTSLGYALTAITAWLFLKEQISPARWAGVTLIMAGVAFVGRTQHSTTGGCEGL